GAAHTCALREGGAVACWGANSRKQLGDGTTAHRLEHRLEPADAVEGLTDAVAVAAGAGHTCALREGGAVACWGANHFGQAGDGPIISLEERSGLAVTEVLAEATAVGAGFDHSCAVREGGAVACWGNNGAGQLGDGSTGGRYTPTPVVFDGT
ncbi:MAG: hypothetical protein WD250_10970, partial [Egibacteraceae bacterium]